MTKLPTSRPTVPKAHELLVMSKLADLYATLGMPARKRVHQHLGEMLDELPTIAQVVAEEPEPPLIVAFRSKGDGADEQAAS